MLLSSQPNKSNQLRNAKTYKAYYGRNRFSKLKQVIIHESKGGNKEREAGNLFFPPTLLGVVDHGLLVVGPVQGSSYQRNSRKRRKK